MSEHGPNDQITGLQLVEYRDFLINVQGYTPAQAGQAIGITAGGRTWAQVGDQNKQWLKDRNPQND